MGSKKIILINFGIRVRELRKKLGISQEELAYKSGLHRTYIGMIERAEKNITLINIEKIANALEFDHSLLAKFLKRLFLTYKFFQGFLDDFDIGNFITNYFQWSIKH